MKNTIATLLAFVFAATNTTIAQTQLLTVAEKTKFQATAPHADVIDFCHQIASEDKTVTLSSMGRTHEGRDIPLLILADPPIQFSADAAVDSRPVIFAMGNIHAGEVCGKEALLMLARDLARKKSKLMSEFILVFAPIYNADGNERFSTENRPKQIGPANGKGQRPNAQGLDLNRDHMKLESPEARSLAKFMNDWKPIIAIDCHTTNGSWHRYALTYDTPRHPATDKDLLEFARDTFLPEIGKTMEAATGFGSFYYGNFSRDHDRWDSYPAAPRYSTHYFGLRNCLGILSEAYAYDTYEQRIRSTYAFVEGILNSASQNKAKVVALVKTAKQNSRSQKSVPSRFEPAALGKTFSIRGYEEDSAGGGRAESPADKEKDYSATYFGIAKPTLSVETPRGYLIPSDRGKILSTLRRHGIAYRPAKPKTIEVSAYKVNSFKRAPREFQGHRLVSDVEVTKSTEQVDATDYVLVSTEQPLTRLIVNLLEPQSSDGLCAWNSFDADLDSEARRYPVLRVESEAMDTIRR